MIKQYYRAKSVEDAVSIIQESKTDIRPMGGGSKLNILRGEIFDVVDLQDLGLDKTEIKGSSLKIGASVTLNSLLDFSEIPEDLKAAIKNQDNQNLRNTATVVGSLLSANSRSSFSAAMLALDTQLLWAPGDLSQSYGEFLPIRSGPAEGKLITQVSFSSNTKLAFESVARTPADLPIVSVAVAKWSSGRTRIVLGGYGKAPMMVLDGQEQGGAVSVVEAAFLTATDQWASAEYRVDAAKILVKRCLDRLEN